LRVFGPAGIRAPRCRGKSLSVRREGERRDNVLVAFEPADLFAGLDVPEPDHFVPAPGREELAVRRKTELGGPLVTRQAGEFLPRFDCPEVDRPVMAAGGNDLSVPGKGGGPDSLLVSAEGSEPPAGPRVPEAQPLAAVPGR